MAKKKWTLDAEHSEVQFKVRHLMVSWVTGSFQKFEATLETEEQDMTTAKVTFTAEISSIFTNNVQRDTHLRSADFFDAENYPQLTFKSDRLDKLSEEEYEMTGTLTMRGMSYPITLKVEYAGVIQDPRGKTRTGFTISGKVKRSDYGITFSRLSEAGEALLGDTVTIIANAEFVIN